MAEIPLLKGGRSLGVPVPNLLLLLERKDRPGYAWASRAVKRDKSKVGEFFRLLGYSG